MGASDFGSALRSAACERRAADERDERLVLDRAVYHDGFADWRARGDRNLSCVNGSGTRTGPRARTTPTCGQTLPALSAPSRSEEAMSVRKPTRP